MATASSSSGIGLSGALFLVFVVLKLTHYIDWSWWWVTAPLWGVFVIAVGMIALGALVGALGLAVGALFGGRRSRR